MNTLQRPETKVNAPVATCNPAVRDRLVSAIQERKIKHGTLTLNIARQLYPKAKTGDEMDVAGAKFLVVD